MNFRDIKMHGTTIKEATKTINKNNIFTNSEKGDIK